MIRQRADELGTYLLPGRVFDPNDGPRQAADAEKIGFGSVWLGDRWEQKEAAAMLGAVTQTTSRVRIGTAVTHPHTRHPLVLAGMATTIQALSGGRFTLGIGRSGGGVWQQRGLPEPTTEMLRDIAILLRGLWAGETVTYRGPLGNFPELRTVHCYEGSPPRLLLAAIGPRSLALAGEFYDGAILHPLLTTQATERACTMVRSGAAGAGRDPDQIRVVATVVVAPDLESEATDAIVGGRAITYLQTPGFGELLVKTNEWDPQVLDRIRSHPMLQSLKGGLADWTFTLTELAEVAQVLPAEWLEQGAAVGSVERCSERITEYLDAGADEVIVHGNDAGGLVSLIDEFAARES